MEGCHVVAPTSCLVVGDDEHAFIVCCALGHGIGDLLLQPSAVAGCVRWMFGELGGADDIRDCWETAVLCLRVEVVEALADHALRVEWRAGESFLELPEPGQWVVVEVVGVLEDGPGDSGILVELCGRFPG